MKLRAGTSAALLVLLAACASPPREETPAPPPNELPMPADPAGRVPARSPKQIVAGIVELMGPERVIFGSDWPHIEGMPAPLDYVSDLAGFDAKTVRMILRDNTLELNSPRPA